MLAFLWLILRFCYSWSAADGMNSSSILMTPLVFVNFKAFESKFIRTYFTLFSSVLTIRFNSYVLTSSGLLFFSFIFTGKPNNSVSIITFLLSA